MLLNTVGRQSKFRVCVLHLNSILHCPDTFHAPFYARFKIFSLVYEVKMLIIVVLLGHSLCLDPIWQGVEP